MSRAGPMDLSGTWPSEPAFVFVIEDDRGIRETLEEFLVESGYRVETSVDAHQALDRLESGVTPDLILLDLMLPAMDGWQFRLEQRARPRLADVPVVVLSADASAKAAAIHADAFVPKPFDFERLRAVIERLLFERRRRQFEQRTRELERLRALGSLVAGVAHEINNPLTFVSANVEISLREWSRIEQETSLAPDVRHRFQRSLEGAIVGAQRIEHVVRALCRFSRAEDERPSPVDLRLPLESAITLAAAQIRARASLVQEIGDLPLVLGSESRLSQVVLNLLVNAAQSIDRGRPDRNEVRVRSFAAERSVVVEVSDTGSGIPEDVLPQIFEPFFTTKAAGEGTGLGLALSKEIIADHGGTISVRSERGVGSTFRIELPAIASTHELAPARTRESFRPSVRPPVPLGRRLLVVDDEPLIGEVFGSALPDFDLVHLADSREALDLVARDASIDAVISDSRVHGMGGDEFFAELVRRRPALAQRFLFATGTIDGAEISSLERLSTRAVLRKPFSVADVHERVHELFDETTSGAPPN